MPGGIFCSKELPLFFDRSGVRMPGGGGVQRNCLCFLTYLGYVCRGGILCSKELPLVFDISGVRMPEGGFCVQRNYLCFLTDLGYVCWGGGVEIFVQRNYFWFLRFFGTNSRRFFQRNCFVFEKFWFWGTYPA